MAAILSIDYTPYYNGCHRICFRSTELEWCCYLDESPTVIGTTKTVSINLSQDYAQCLVTVPTQIGCSGDTEITGYIQACCVDADSLVDRIPFSTDFPQEECSTYSVSCTESGIGEITINNPGYGYPIGVVPTITVTDSSGLGTGFVGTVTMECLPGDNFCSIDDITITDPGENYYNLNTLTVDVSPLPSCISDELITNGDFATDLSGWTLEPAFAPNIFVWNAGNARYNSNTYGNTTPGFISQNILTPGRTYEIRIDTLALGCTTGYLQFTVSAGDFDISGTQPNQFNVFRTFTDPVYTTPISVTLTCVGSTSFNIYAYTTDASPAARLDFSDVSVIEICTVIDPELEVTDIDKCGTFTIPGCGETPNPNLYEIWGGSASVNSIYVCSPDPGPVGPKYDIQAEPGISCCACKLYNIIVRNPIDMYYTDCFQTIDIISVEAGVIGVTVCAIENSVWPANPLDNAEILSITEVGDCTPTN